MVGSWFFDFTLAGFGGAVTIFFLFGHVFVVASRALPFAVAVLVVFVIGTPLARRLRWIIVHFHVAVGVSISAGYGASTSAVDGDLWGL